MPTCVICEADGVLEAAGGWYCTDHLEEALIATAEYVANARGWTEKDLDNIVEWILS